MKPSNLKTPFIWEKRHILVEDRVWYIPDQFEDFASFSFPGWTHPSFFEEERPISLEYCSGNGAWIAVRAQEHPECNWVAIEYQFDRVRKIWSKIKNFQLSNLLAVCGEGYAVTRHYLPSASVQNVYINFPDPWPKKRHAKHRLIQFPFIEEIHRILKPGGHLTMVTDDEAYSHIMIAVLSQFSGFKSLYPEPYYTHHCPQYGTSYFEELWRQKGKMIRYHSFCKINQ